MTSYLLPLEVLVEMMKEFPKQVLLQAQLSSVPGFSRVPCVAHIIVGAGDIHSCMIKEVKTGHVLKKSTEAVSTLQACGELHWTLQRQEPLHIPEQSHHALKKETGKVPRRAVTVTSVQMRALPHALKQVFSLVNGANSIERIASLLNKSPEEIYQILFKLQEKGVIFL